MASRPRATLNVIPLEDRITPAAFLDGQAVLAFHPGAEQTGLAAVLATPGVVEAKGVGFGVYRVRFQTSMPVPAAVSTLTALPGVRFAEPDYKLEKDAVPNDARFSEQWAHRNTGQTGGTAGADANSVAGWDINFGTRGTIVAVLDDGADYTHPDLAANMWRNPGETPGNGTDDDGNGYVDDVFGINAADNNGDPMPQAGNTHGTHVSGIVAAVGDNGIGVTGVARNTRLMAVDIFGASGGGMSAAVAGFQYAIANGARVINASWSFIDAPRPAALEMAVAAAKAAGVILVCSGGNQSRDNDAHDRWPSNFIDLHDNVVPVAALDHNDQLASFSNTGLTKLPLGAPGVDILSTLPGNGYVLNSGTSMASPHVAGAVTLAFDQSPSSTYADVVRALFESVTPIPALTGLTSTGGKLNLAGLLGRLGSNVFATGAGEGGGPHVKVYRANGVLATQFMAYHPSFTGGVRVATGDVTGDKQSDIVTVPGPGGGPHVKVFDGRTGAEVYSFMAFEPTFRGGLTVATGDVNGDGRADIIIGAEAGGGPRVRVFSRLTPTGGLTSIADFFAYDPAFTGGVRVSAGVFTAGSMQADLITAPGAGGGPHLKRFSAATISNPNPTVVMQTMVGDANDRSGLWIAAGDLTGDGVADVATGVGSGTATVRVLDGRSLAPIQTLRNPTSGELPGLTNPNSSTQVGSTTPPPTNNGLLAPGSVPGSLPFTGNSAVPGGSNRFGVRVAVQDVNGDKKPDLILAGGPFDSPTISLLDGRTYATLNSYLAYDPQFFGGVYVGGVGA